MAQPVLNTERLLLNDFDFHVCEALGLTGHRIAADLCASSSSVEPEKFAGYGKAR